MNILTASFFPPGRARRSAGFTLIELMIAVAIVAILAAIAIPSYQQHIIKSRRADARAALLDYVSRQERYFSVNNKYADPSTLPPTVLGYSATAYPFDITSGDKVFYRLEAAAVAAVPATNRPATFRVIARRYGAQTADTTCNDFVLTGLGEQTNTNTAGALQAAAIPGCW